MLDGKDIIVLSKEEGRKLLELIRLPYSGVYGHVTNAELKIYQDRGALGLVEKLKELIKEE